MRVLFAAGRVREVTDVEVVGMDVGDGQIVGTVAVAAGHLISGIDKHTGGQKRFQNGGVQLAGPVLDVRFVIYLRQRDWLYQPFKAGHGVTHAVVGGNLPVRVVDEDLFIGAVDPEHIVIVDDGLGTAQEEVSQIVQG